MLILVRNAPYDSSDSGRKAAGSEKQGEKRPHPEFAVEPIAETSGEYNANYRKEGQLKSERQLPQEAGRPIALRLR